MLEGHLARRTEVKNQIVRANLRLVVSVARKHLRPGLSLMELISDGNITLMRAVEGFDVHRGHRFSTYATLALMKGFARSVPQMLSATRRPDIRPGNPGGRAGFAQRSPQHARGGSRRSAPAPVAARSARAATCSSPTSALTITMSPRRMTSSPVAWASPANASAKLNSPLSPSSALLRFP